MMSRFDVFFKIIPKRLEQCSVLGIGDFGVLKLIKEFLCLRIHAWSPHGR